MQQMLSFCLYLLATVGLLFFFLAYSLEASQQVNGKKPVQEKPKYQHGAYKALCYLLENAQRTPDGYSLSLEVVSKAREIYRLES